MAYVISLGRVLGALDAGRIPHATYAHAQLQGQALTIDQHPVTDEARALVLADFDAIGMRADWLECLYAIGTKGEYQVDAPAPEGMVAMYDQEGNLTWRGRADRILGVFGMGQDSGGGLLANAWDQYRYAKRETFRKVFGNPDGPDLGPLGLPGVLLLVGAGVGAVVILASLARGVGQAGGSK